MASVSIACIGAGNVGRSRAIMFARAGHDVAIWDADASKAEDAARVVDAA